MVHKNVATNPRLPGYLLCGVKPTRQSSKSRRLAGQVDFTASFDSLTRHDTIVGECRRKHCEGVKPTIGKWEGFDGATFSKAIVYTITKLNYTSFRSNCSIPGPDRLAQRCCVGR